MQDLDQIIMVDVPTFLIANRHGAKGLLMDRFQNKFLFIVFFRITFLFQWKKLEKEAGTFY